jgi:hypothetical protein
MMIRDGRPIMFKNKGEWYPFTCGWYTEWFMESVFDIMKLPRQHYWLESYPQFLAAMKMPGFDKVIYAIENDMLFGAF